MAFLRTFMEFVSSRLRSTKGAGVRLLGHTEHSPLMMAMTTRVAVCNH